MGNIQDFISAINKSYKGGIVEVGGKFRSLKLKRFSSGIISLDVALGGGWPFSRVSVLAGNESTGKSLLTIRAMAAVENYDHNTKQHKKQFEGSIFSPGRALLVDAEAGFDIDWAIANGFNDTHHVVARTEYSEQAIDIVNAAIHENCFDLIIVDSIAALTPAKEADSSLEDWTMGLAARINNRAMRTWNSSLVKMSQGDLWGPALICINQFRMSIGINYGDPRVLPGGIGQRFCSSIIIYTKTQKYDDKTTEGKVAELGKVTLSGTVLKNKTYIPKQNYAFDLSLRDVEGAVKGDINNVDMLMDYGKKYKLISTSGKVKFGKYEFGTQKEMKAKVAVSEEIRSLLWDSIVRAATGY